MAYAQPHKSHDELVRILAEKSLPNIDHERAVENLKAIGYHRLKGYATPLTRGVESHGMTPTSFEEAVLVYKFDEAVRNRLLDGLFQVEVGLRISVGHTLGLRDPLGHIHEESLERSRCIEPPIHHAGAKETAFLDWVDGFNREKRRPASKPLVAMYRERHGGEMPVWAATEVMTFACLVSLYRLLKTEDSNRVATELGFSDWAEAHTYLSALRELRNDCAHNRRVFDRSATSTLNEPTFSGSHSNLHHLIGTDTRTTAFLSTVCAHLICMMNPAANGPPNSRP